MTVLGLFGLVVLVGLCVTAIRLWAPIDEKFKALSLWIGLAIVVVITLYAFGILPVGWNPRVPQVH